ncbi:MAG: L-lactate dehydrogenase [Vallitaleaceae bacterium]|jgi:L-lactate dehydrogenase|nr:L-lactate dehydrogenase [Vallitaleaceae bacterium]
MKISNSKVVIIGAGMVGSATAYSLIVQGICAEVVLVDRNMDKAIGEALDLQHGIEFLNRNVHVRAGNYDECKDADVVVITASIPMHNIKSRNELLDQNIIIMDSVVAQIMASGFDGHIIVVSNPVDILSYYVYKKSGLPKNQVMGTGTSLETARLKKVIGNIVNIDPRSVHAYVIGEHGENMTVPWSHVLVGGKGFIEAVEDDIIRFKDVNLDKIVEETAQAGFEVYNRKGSTQYGIASATTGIIKSILHDERRMISISALLDGEYGEIDLFCGVPAILGKEGIIEIAQYHLTDDEAARFKKSTMAIKAHIAGLRLED